MNLHPIPRYEWMMWCDDLSHVGGPHLEVTEPETQRGIVRQIDFAPFDDLLELDVDHGEAVEVVMIDHPDRILVEEAPEAGNAAVVIESPDEVVRLILVRPPAARRDVPSELLGAYFDG